MKENKRSETDSGAQNKNGEFYEKAQKIISVYTQTTGCGICVYDHDCAPFTDMINVSTVEKNICPYCVRYHVETNSAAGFGNRPDVPSVKAQTAEPCHELHVNAINEAGSEGGSHIYSCELGFVFWASPIYNEGRFNGALRGSGCLREDQEERQKDRASVMCNGTILAEEFSRRISAFPGEDSEKIQALAEMLLLCAESLSSGSEDYHEILRRRAEQQRILAAMVEKLKAKYPTGSVPPGYPLDKERLLIAALRRGDNTTVLHILNELLAILIFANPSHFKYIQMRAVELVVLLFREEIHPGHNGTVALEANNRCLKQVQEAKTIEELTDILHSIVKRIAGQISSFQGIRHGAALRKAERFIRENFTRKISLQEIATASGFSAPYFSTIFKEEMGENLSKYLNRLRVERASHLLLETDLSLSEIAGACCFEDQSWFSKIFKAYTGLSPGKYRSQGGGMIQEISENNLSEDFLKTFNNK
jgi:AraC-like DNA-binding protein/ligand-binding sensor protein